MMDLPRIVKFIGTTDTGPGGNASCPHCGARGRYIVRFQVADGRQLGAMRGCVQLFPVSELARQHCHFLDKRQRYVAKGWRLNCEDSAALDAIEAAIAGTLDEYTALFMAREAMAHNAARGRLKRR